MTCALGRDVDNIGGGSGIRLDPPYDYAEITEGGQARGPAPTDPCGTVQRDAAGGLGVSPRFSYSSPKIGGQRGLTTEVVGTAHPTWCCQIWQLTVQSTVL